MALDSCSQNPFSFFWKRGKQVPANSEAQRLLEPIEKKVRFTSSLDMDHWHELFIRLMVLANPYKLVKDYDAVPEARGQKASWQLPHAMAMIPFEDLPAAYADLFKENVTDPIQNTMYLFEDNNTPSRVWREGRAEKHAFSRCIQTTFLAQSHARDRSKRAAGRVSLQATTSLRGGQLARSSTHRARLRTRVQCPSGTVTGRQASKQPPLTLGMRGSCPAYTSQEMRKKETTIMCPSQSALTLTTSWQR